MSESAEAWQPVGEDFRAAKERIKNHVHITPLLRAEALDRAGHKVFVKTENLQRTGSFKVRGAFNAVASLTPEQRATGVVTHSSGNHAQAMALAARELGMAEQGKPYPCTVVVPEDALTWKVARTRALGAQIVTAGRDSADREAKARELAETTGRILIPSYDDPRIIAGQGTLGPELMDQWMGMPLRTRKLSLVAGAVSGGGLMSGVAAGLRTRGFAGPIVGVEPEGADDTRRSMESGARESIEDPQTVCDALRVRQPGKITFPILQKCGVKIRTVTEDQVKQAVILLLREAKLVVEPSGAVAVAAWISGTLDDLAASAEATGDVVFILSGGNMSLSQLTEWNT
jgi:threonine dehydratase